MRSNLLASRNLEYDSGFTLPPGDYTVKFLARENVTGKMGTFETKFTVPDLLRGFHVAAHQFRRLEQPARAVARRRGFGGEEQETAGGASAGEDGKKLVPSITRVYRKDQNLYVYAEVYDPGVAPDTKRPSVMASLALYRQGLKQFETEPRACPGPGVEPRRGPAGAFRNAARVP